ncbi:MAG TPA: sigma-70 family RNA polymerase sigma factor [Pseudomonadales bacterium]
MGEPTNTSGSERNSAIETLGEVLYADGADSLLTEQEWVALVRSMADGDQLALRRLYERSKRIVFTLIMRLTNDRAIAEEVTLDVFLDVWRQASRYDPAGGTVVGWIMNRARSRAIDRLRFEHRKKRVNTYADDGETDPAPNDPRDSLDVEQQGRRLRDAMAMLTPDEREAVEIAYFSELTYSQVADRLNAPVGTVKTRIRSALGKLRDALGGTGTQP